MFRQGDVLIVPVGAMPNGLKAVPREKGRVVLAHGETTGHAHAILDKGTALFRDPKLNKIFMRVADAPASLKHEEHGTISIPVGDYEIIRQREYSPERDRYVAD